MDFKTAQVTFPCWALIRSVLLIGALGCLMPVDSHADGAYESKDHITFLSFPEAESFLRSGDPQHEGLVLSSTTTGPKSATWVYNVPSVEMAIGAPVYIGVGFTASEEGVVVQSFTDLLAGATGFCEFTRGPEPLGDWGADGKWGDVLISTRSYVWETKHGTDCDQTSTAYAQVFRHTPYFCPPSNPILDLNGYMCLSTVTGTIIFAPKTEAYYLSAANKSRSTPPSEGGGCHAGNPKEGNPCDAVTGDKIERAVDFVAPGGLALTRTYTTPTHRWIFDFESNVTMSQPGIYADYRGGDGDTVQSAIFSSKQEACEEGWSQIADRAEPGMAGSMALLHGDECAIMVDGVARFRLQVYAYFESQPAGAPMTSLNLPDGRQLRYLPEDGMAPVDGGVTSAVKPHGSGVILENGGGETEAFDGEGKKESYTRDGHRFTITRSADQVTVADEFGRSYTASYINGHVGHVDLPDQSTIDYTWEGDNLLQATFRKGESVETEEYGYQQQGAFTLLASHSYNGVPYAAWRYDTLGRATRSTHAGGAEPVTLEYGNGYTTVTRALGDVRVLHTTLVSKAARLSQIDDGHGKVYERRTYDPNGFLASWTDALGHVTTYVHDKLGREQSRTEGDGTELARTITTTWDPEYTYFPATITTPTLVTSYSYTTAGRVTRLTETDRTTGRQRTTTVTYTDSGEGRLITLDGPRTDVADLTQVRYDSAGNLTRITNALGHTIQFADHDGAGRPRTVTDPNGRSAQLDYDGRGRLRYLKAGTEITSLTYTPAGDLHTLTLPSGETYTYTWDDARRLTAIADSAGNRIEYVLDALGNHQEEKVFAADGTETRHVHQLFNTLGQLWQTTNHTGDLTAAYGYNDNGELGLFSDGLSHTTARTYDALNRLHEITDARNGVATYAYRSDDLVESVTDPNRNTTRYEYNGFGDLVRQESPDTGVTTFTYDDAGNLLTRTDAKGQTATYTYDALNRLTTANYTDGTITYTWDTAPDNGLGRLASLRDFSGTTSYNYDPHGRIKAKRQNIVGRVLATFYDYDIAGRLKSITYPSGMVVTYRHVGEKVTDILVNGYKLLSDITYEPFGGPVRWNFRNGQVYQRSFNLDGQLTAHTLGIEQRQLGYDLAGNITSLTDTQGATFGYDELNRLTSATSPVFNLGWDYDANGNRQHLTSSAGTTSYEYLPGTNRLSAIDGETYALVNHDPNGNRTGDGSHSYQYDPRDRLVTVDQGATATYLYNALGQRVGKETPAGRRGFAYNEAGQLLGEYDWNRNPLQETVWLGDLPVVTIQSGVSYYIHPDHLGTPRLIADQSGRTVWRWDSEPFGSDEANEDPDGDGVRLGYNLRFAGQHHDSETNHNYNYFRHYDPGLGRYIESDPIGLSGGLNAYAYSRQNPSSLTDPLGLMTAVAIGGESGGNPFGHVAIAFSGAGVYSFGTNTQLGSSFTKYLASQAAYRNTTVILLDTTPEQEQTMKNYLKSLSNVPLPDPRKDPWKAYDTCAARTNEALLKAGFVDPRNILSASLFGNVSPFPADSYNTAWAYSTHAPVRIPTGGNVPTDLTTFDP